MSERKTNKSQNQDFVDLLDEQKFKGKKSSKSFNQIKAYNQP